MKKYLSIIAMSLILSFYGTSGFALVYDFTSPQANVLDKLTQGTYTVANIPLEVQAGTMTPDGTFTLGGLSSIMCIDSSGLGVTQPVILFCNQLQADTAGDPTTSDHEALVFNFDSLLNPTAITLSSFFPGEDIRIFTDGNLFGDFLGVNSTGVLAISLPGSISMLGITALGNDSPLDSSDDSDYWVASIEGSVVPVPEPSTVLLLGTGLFGLVFFRTKLRRQ